MKPQGNLLSVDWDYFFPNPIASTTMYKRNDVLLYDWGQVENAWHIGSPELWMPRAVGFLGNDLPLPRCASYKGFWNRFDIEPGTRLVVAESHSQAANSLPGRGRAWADVWNYDAHHDCGYQDEQWADALDWTEASCENWMITHALRGSKLHVRYPKWKGDGTEVEKAPAVPVDRKSDPGGPVKRTFQGAFLCRSGAWVPPWNDDQFEEFVASYPGPVERLPLVEREWDREAAAEMVEAFAEMKRRNAERLGV